MTSIVHYQLEYVYKKQLAWTLSVTPREYSTKHDNINTLPFCFSEIPGWQNLII